MRNCALRNPKLQLQRSKHCAILYKKPVTLMNTDSNMLFGSRLKRARIAAKLSQDFTAHALGVTRQAVSRWETGLSVPDAGLLVRIAGALDTTVNDLLGEEEPEQGRDLAAELEALNRQLAEREERSRRRWRAFFAAVGILALWGAVMLAAGLIR